jgi:hypothetical protein
LSPYAFGLLLRSCKSDDMPPTGAEQRRGASAKKAWTRRTYPCSGSFVYTRCTGHRLLIGNSVGSRSEPMSRFNRPGIESQAIRAHPAPTALPGARPASRIHSCLCLAAVQATNPQRAEGRPSRRACDIHPEKWISANFARESALRHLAHRPCPTNSICVQPAGRLNSTQGRQSCEGAASVGYAYSGRTKPGECRKVIAAVCFAASPASTPKAWRRQLFAAPRQTAQSARDSSGWCRSPGGQAQQHKR